MSLKYNCSLCGFEMITDFLKRGEIYRCISCGNKVEVPDEAVFTDEEPNIQKKEVNPYLNNYRYGDDPALVPGNTPFIAEEELPPVEKVKKERLKEWGVWSVIKFIIAYIISIILVLICSMIISKIVSSNFYPENVNGEWIQNEIELEMSIKLAELVNYFIPLILIYYSVVRRHKNRFFEALNINKLSKKETVRWIKFSALFTFTIVGFIALFEFTPLKIYLPSDIPLDQYFKEGYLEIVIFSIFGLIAPIQEEIIFRGYIFKGLEYKWGPIWSGIVVTVLFVAMHGGQLAFSPILLSFILAGSIFKIIVRIKTGSLTKCIIIHQVHNTILTMLIWIWILLFGLDSIT